MPADASRSRGTWVRTAAGLLISAACLYFTVRRLDWSQFVAVLHGVRLELVACACCLTSLAYALRGERWRAFFRPNERPSWGRSLRVLLVGYAGNNLLPARAGEVLRAHTLSAATGIPTASVLATVLLERAFDALTLCLLFMLAVPLLGRQLQMPGLVGLSVAVVVVLGALYGVWRWKGDSLLAGADQATGWRRLLAHFVDGLHALGSRHALVKVVGLSMIIWLFDLGGFWCSMSAFPQVSVPVAAALVVLVFGNLGTMIPSAPSAVGTFELAVVEVLRPWVPDRTLAFSMALVIHLTQFLITTVPGVIFWVLGEKPDRAN